MKRFWCAMLLIAVLVTAFGCAPRDKDNGVSFAWKEHAQQLPRGVKKLFSFAEGDGLAKVVSSDGEVKAIAVKTGGQDGSDSCLYSLYSPDGKCLLQDKTDMYIEGLFVWTTEVGEDLIKLYKVYDCTGNELVATTTSFSISALDDEHFAFYLGDWSTVVDSHGRRYIPEGLMSDDQSYCVCDKWLLCHRAIDNAYTILEMAVLGDRGSTVTLKRFDDALYDVAYLGDGRFWVVSTKEGGNSPTYYESVGGVDYAMEQTSFVYNANTGETRSFGEHIVVTLVNAYTPYLKLEERSALPFGTGFTAVNVAVLEGNKRVGARYIVVDNATGRQVASLPASVAPLSVSCAEGYLFTGAGESNYAVGLYAKDGSLLWRNTDHPYQNIKFNDGRLVAAYLDNGWLRYGAFDTAGQVAVAFDYQYLSPFVGGHALAYSDQVYSIVDSKGIAVRTVTPDANIPLWETGMYQEGDVLYNFDGEVLLREVQAVAVKADTQGAAFLYVQTADSLAVWRIIYG